MGKTIVEIGNVVPGMVLAESVLSAHKQVILDIDTELTSHLINRLKNWRISSVLVRTQTAFSYCDSIPLVQNELYTAEFSVQYRKVAQEAKKAFECMRDQEKIPYETFCRMACHDLYDLIEDANTLNYLYQLKPLKLPEEYTYLHTIDVGMISGLIARWCGFKEEEVKELILAGLMHDIGKSQIPLSILDNPNKPSVDEKAILELHPVYGYYMVRTLPKVSKEIQYGILHHHERENGGGYPQGLRSNNIHPFAKIIAIADAYDAMTSNRMYQNSITPFAALDVLTNEIVSHFDREYCKIFIGNTIEVLKGATVLLSDKTQAKVLYFNRFMSVQPAVKRFDGSLLDLGDTKVSIIEVLKFA